MARDPKTYNASGLRNLYGTGVSWSVKTLPVFHSCAFCEAKLSAKGKTVLFCEECEAIYVRADLGRLRYIGRKS